MLGQRRLEACSGDEDDLTRPDCRELLEEYIEMGRTIAELEEQHRHMSPCKARDELDERIRELREEWTKQKKLLDECAREFGDEFKVSGS